MPINQEVIPRGVGTFSRDLTKQGPCSAGILPGFCIWKNQYSRYSPALGGMWLQMTGALLVGFHPATLSVQSTPADNT